jgi:hypothetical protein
LVERKKNHQDTKTPREDTKKTAKRRTLILRRAGLLTGRRALGTSVLPLHVSIFGRESVPLPSNEQ